MLGTQNDENSLVSFVVLFVIREKACWIIYRNPFAREAPIGNSGLAIELWLSVLSGKEKVTVDCIKGTKCMTSV